MTDKNALKPIISSNYDIIYNTTRTIMIQTLQNRKIQSIYILSRVKWNIIKKRLIKLIEFINTYGNDNYNPNNYIAIRQYYTELLRDIERKCVFCHNKPIDDYHRCVLSFEICNECYEFDYNKSIFQKITKNMKFSNDFNSQKTPNIYYLEKSLFYVNEMIKVLRG